MEIKVTDSKGMPLTNEQILELKIWNAEMSHICSSVLERLAKEKKPRDTLIDNSKHL